MKPEPILLHADDPRDPMRLTACRTVQGRNTLVCHAASAAQLDVEAEHRALTPCPRCRRALGGPRRRQ